MPSLSNTLLLLPQHQTIEPSQLADQLQTLLQRNRERIEQLLAQLPQPTWDSLVAPIEEWNDELERFWSPVSHLHAVKNNAELRQAYEQCLPLLSEYSTEMGQNQALYAAYQTLADSEQYQTLDQAQQQVVQHALRDFKLSGVALPQTQRERFGDIRKRLSELATQFSNNLLDANQGWQLELADESQLAGIPDTVMEQYRQAGRSRGRQGLVITLDIPSYLPAMQYAEDRELRETLYQAFVTRASDCGPNAGKWDNSQVMEEILALRHELATLLGFDNYAAYSLATKMANDCDQVTAFLQSLAQQSLPSAQQDFAELSEFARAELAIDDLQAWDIPFASEKLRLKKYALSQQELRPYFPADKVLEGLFTIVQRLFDIRIEPLPDADRWHDDVRAYRILQGDELIAAFYLDLFARENKRGGAWMADSCSRRRNLAGELQLPIAYLVCNFTPPGEQQPSLLTHDEVTTLFHEFGHGLHHMLTRIETSSVSGINGVEWDAVELPSQFLENWCWDEQSLALISGHYETGETLPAQLLEKMLAAKNFQSGMQMLRQLEFALFDFQLHQNYQADNPQPIQQLLDQLRSELAVYQVPDYNRFQHSFAHIFAGGYAAGYYSYKWAEVLSADAFSRFEEEGLFNADTGRDFLQKILQRGGSQPAAKLFADFRGREPSPAALLRHSGISPDKAA